MDRQPRDKQPRRRVLVVEDELMVAMGLEMALQSCGFEVVGPVGRFPQALAAAERDQIDAALLDVNLRGDEVFPVADALAARGVPFVFLTGYGRENLPQRYRDSRMLTKPFSSAELFATIDSLAHAEAAPLSPALYQAEKPRRP